jgi:Protein of unknown function (DUF1214)
MKTSHAFRVMVVCAVAMTLVAACERNDSVTQAEKADKINGVAVRGIEETKQIAQEGFDSKTQFLIKNPINYLINSPMLPGMKTNPDGSLALYIRKDSPGKEKESNCLPAPDGPIYLVMRLYWPKENPPSILPTGKGTWQPPGVVAAS